MLVKICALIALLAFAQVVRAQDESEDFKEKEHKQDDSDDMSLEERGGSYGRYRNRGENWRREGQRGNYRNGGGSRGLGGLGLNGVRLANQVVTNKVVPGTVEVAPTVVTNSNSVQVLASTRRRNFQQNSKSRVVQNNVIKATDIHIHTNRVIRKPKTINTVVRRHKTEYIINTQPIKTNINIERQQEIIKPEVQNVVVYQNTESLRRHRLHTIVRNKQEHQRLPTIRERVQNDGTQVIGNPVNAGSASLALVNGGYNGNRNENVYRGGARRVKSLYGRANEAAQEEQEEEVAPAAAQEEEEAATN